MGRGVVLVLPLALVATALSGCLLAEGADLDVQAPQIKAGYAYAFSGQGQVDVSGRESGDSFSESDPIDPYFYKAEVLSTLFTTEIGSPVYLLAVHQGEFAQGDMEAAQPAEAPVPTSTTAPGELTLDASAAGGSAVSFDSSPRLAALRQSDLSHVPVHYTLSTSCSQGGGGQGSQSPDPNCNYRLSGFRIGPDTDVMRYNFPLTNDKSWEAVLRSEAFDADLEMNEGNAFDWNVRSKVIGESTVNTGVGAVSAVRVDTTYAPANLQQWKQELLAEAAEDGVRVDSFDYNAAIRIRAFYSPDYQMEVRTEFLQTETFAAKGVDDDGEPFDFQFNLRFFAEETLEGARLIPKPEKDLDYASRVLFGEIPVANPVGEAYQPVGYTIEIVSEANEVNAAEAEEIGFEIKLAGVEALPAGHSVTWRILDLKGDEVMAGEGLAFTHVFDQPGIYSVEAIATNENAAVTAVAGSSIVANFEQIIDAGCATYGLFTSCDLLPIPIHVGIQEVEITAMADSLVQPISRSGMELLDAAGDEVAYEMSSQSEQSVRLTASDLDDYAVNDSDWLLQWNQQAAVLQDVVFDVRLMYGIAQPEPAEPEPENGSIESSWRLPHGLVGNGLAPGSWSDAAPSLAKPEALLNGRFA